MFIILILVFTLMLVYALMAAYARIVHVEYTDLYLSDLPEAFDGTTILYISDIHIASESDVTAMNKLMSRLEGADADLLLLGGDYSDVRLWDQVRSLNNTEMKDALYSKACAYSHEWMTALADFDAPMGKFAVQGNHDVNDIQLEDALAEGGVTLLSNQSIAIEKDGARIIIAGVGDYTDGDYNLYAVSNSANASDCVILLCHNPDAMPQICTTDAADGGAWADLVLSGHTHGGQVRIGNLIPINKSNYGMRYLSGWHEEIHTHQLTSNGAGTTALPIRLGAPAKVHIITLHAQP